MFNPETMPTIPANVREAMDAAEDAGQRAKGTANIRATRRAAEAAIIETMRQCQLSAYEAGFAAGQGKS